MIIRVRFTANVGNYLRDKFYDLPESDNLYSLIAGGLADIIQFPSRVG